MITICFALPGPWCINQAITQPGILCPGADEVYSRFRKGWPARITIGQAETDQQSSFERGKPHVVVASVCPPTGWSSATSRIRATRQMSHSPRTWCLP